jgi:translation elongation factor EF-G
VYGTQNLGSRDIATLRSLKDLSSMNLYSRLAQVFKGTIRKNNLIRNLLLIIVLCLPSPQNK